MSAAVASTQVNPKSLLSRISPVKSVLSTNASTSTVMGKRNIQRGENARLAKRRRSFNEGHVHASLANHFTPWLKTTDDSNNVKTCESRLHDELLQFVEYISPSKQECEARNIVVSRIEMLLQKRWPDARVEVFGSSATGLALAGGDIDLVVSFDDCLTLSSWEKKTRLASMGGVLRKAGLTTWVNRIFGARIPIITFATTEELGEISVDISIRNEEEAGIRAIPLVKQYLTEMQALKPLILAVKAFLSLHELNDLSQGTLSSYAITLMCISFLQRNPTGIHQKQLDDPYSEKSLGLLLIDFFRHYGHDFPYSTHYISVSDKGAFPKESKNWEVKRNDPAILTIQCMLNPDNNITRGCKKIAMVVEAFKEALDELQSTPLRTSNDDTSLLCRIYEIYPEDDARRHQLDESINTGTFARSTASGPTLADLRAISSMPLSIYTDSRTDRNSNARGLHMAQITGLGHLESVNRGFPSNEPTRQLPILRWQDGRVEQLHGAPFSKHQFNIQPHTPHFQNMQSNYVQGGDSSAPERYPSRHPRPNYGYHDNSNFNNLNKVIQNHLAPRSGRGTRRPYDARH